jgi:N-acetyl-gamma-glutamyl-phosphate reductase
LLKCAIVGASGYVGAELVSLVAAHPEARLVSIYSESHAGERWERLYPARRHLWSGTLAHFEPSALAGLDVVFLALPHGASARTAALLDGRVGRIIDLSGDLRLRDAASYERWYGMPHAAPHLLERAVYGLPELFRDELRDARLIACAGCYATAVQLAAAPALALGAGSADRDAPFDVTVAATSGTSGAGRKAELALSFSEVHGDLRAYRVGRHQHAPEIAAGLARWLDVRRFADIPGGNEPRPANDERRGDAARVRVTFVPQLAPIERGILATVILRNPERLDLASLLGAYRSAYADCPLVRIVDSSERLPAVRDVVGSSFCDIAPVIDVDGGSVVVVAVIDNLLKGAAGQAVQAMNISLGIDEVAGLLPARTTAPAAETEETRRQSTPKEQEVAT